MSGAPPWLTVLDECASTNSWALERLSDLAHGSVVMARRQTAGRGREGRSWIAPTGSIAASFIIHAPTGMGLSSAAGLAVIHAIEDLRPGLHLGLKWPNDVILAGGKLAGILCEGGSGRWVVGIGLNRSAEFSGELSATATSLHRHADPPAEDELVAGIRGYLMQGAGLLATRGLGALLPQVRERDVLLGRSIHVETRGGAVDGTGAGIDEAGRLLVVVPHGGIAAIDAGHIAAW